MKKDIIDSFNRFYKKELEESIKKLEPFIIEAFVSIYGEKHRDYITYTIKNLKYVYYLAERDLQVISLNLKNVQKVDRIVTEKYLEYFKLLDLISKTIPEENLGEFILRNYIVGSNLKFDTLLEEDAALFISDQNPIFTFFIEENKIYKTIFLPIFVVDLKTLFHEINHALTMDAIAFYNKKLFSTDLFRKSIASEIINDYIAHLAYLKCLKITPFIPKYENRFQIYDHYPHYYNIAELVMEYLGPVILESLISHKPNLFIELTGEKNYHHLCQLINHMFKHDYGEEEYLELYHLVNKMQEHVLNHEEIDYESYMEELKEKGYRVRKL